MAQLNQSFCLRLAVFGLLLYATLSVVVLAQQISSADTHSNGDDASQIEPIDVVVRLSKMRNIRSQASIDSTVLDQLDAGTSLTILGRVPNQDWYLIEYRSGKQGYLFDRSLATLGDDLTTRVRPKLPPQPLSDTIDPMHGRYFALVIGNNDYSGLPQLKTAIPDAEAIGNLLETSYGFKVTSLLNATRATTLSHLSKLRKSLTPTDNLLIYYAGHGWLDKEMDEGFWLPIDATEGDQVNWISNETIVRYLRSMRAKQILVIADSCFAGTLTRGFQVTQSTITKTPDMSRLKSRTVLASGGLEPVIDSGGSGHSVFADALLSSLGAARSTVEAHQLFIEIRQRVRLESDQSPAYSNVRKAGHEPGGDFLFVRTAKIEVTKSQQRLITGAYKGEVISFDKLVPITTRFQSISAGTITGTYNYTGSDNVAYTGILFNFELVPIGKDCVPTRICLRGRFQEGSLLGDVQFDFSHDFANFSGYWWQPGTTRQTWNGWK